MQVTVSEAHETTAENVAGLTSPERRADAAGFLLDHAEHVHPTAAEVFWEAAGTVRGA